METLSREPCIIVNPKLWETVNNYFLEAYGMAASENISEEDALFVLDMNKTYREAFIDLEYA